MNEKGRSQWREYVDPAEFFNFTGWDRCYLGLFLKQFDVYAKIGYSFPDWLLFMAQRDMALLHFNLESEGLDTQINWKSIPYRYGMTMTESSADGLIYVWIQVKKSNYLIIPQKEVANMLATLLPIAKREENKPRDTPMALAFHREEKLTPDGRRASELILRKLLQYYNDYHDQIHLAPYTTIVGPSGIGKSFSIQQIATQHDVYVVYTSLARKGSDVYPRRSAIADILPQSSIRQTLVEFWECYLTINLCEVAICKEVGISPAGFFNLQTKYQTDLSQRLRKFFQEYKGQKEDIRSKMNMPRPMQLLLTHVEGSRVSLPMWQDVLNKNGDNGSQNSHQIHMYRAPKALVCLDEARELIKDEECLLFRSLREALRKRFNRFGNSIDPTKPQRDFSAVLLDTTFNVWDSPPPAHWDHNQKGLNVWGVRQKHFPPIYSVDTKDIFHKSQDTQIQNGSPEAAVKLFSLGRPLWGGRADVEQVNFSLPEDVAVAVRNLAWQKTEGQGPSFALALLSYRINFNVMNDTLAEDMVNRFLRYVVYINEARDVLRTTQPSEPILAFVASERMKDPGTRLRVIRQFVRSCFEGTVNVGDVGEITASLLFLLAYDEAVQSQQTFPAPIPLAHFMTSMFGPQPGESMGTCMVTDQDMKKLWETGQVFFNHFVKVSKVPDAAKLEETFERGAALFLPDKFPGADILIPIRVPGSKMTFCLVQVKNRKRDHSTPDLRNKAISALTHAVDELGLSRNHIGVMMCLRRQQHTICTENDDRFQVLLPEIQNSRATRSTKSFGSYKWPKNSKRLVAIATGLDAELYPFIDQCMGARTEETAQILPTLQRLLDCVPGTSLPDDIEEDFVRRLMPLG